MTAWSAWYDHTLPELNGVELPLLDMYIRKAAIEFLNDTAVYTLPLALVNVVANTNEYSLVSPDNQAEVFMARSAWYDNNKLDYAPVKTLETGYIAWESMTTERATAYTQQRFDKIRLFPTPTTSLVSGLRITAALRPTLTAASLADHIASQYFFDIAAGVKTMLMGMGGKPWTNPTGEAKYRADFEAGKTQATIDTNRSYIPSALQVQLRAIR